MGVLGTDDWSEAVESLDGPGDVKGGVVPDDGTFALGIVEMGGFIEDLGGFGEDKKTVSKTFGDPERLEISGIREWLEVKASPLAEVGRATAKIDGDIPYMAGEYADELPLGFAELIMESAKDALGGEGLVVLNELGGKVGLREGSLIEDLCEPAAIIAKTFGLNKFDVEQRGIEDLHLSSVPSKPGR